MVSGPQPPPEAYGTEAFCRWLHPVRFFRFASVLLFVALAAAVAAQGPSGLDPSVPPMRALIERFSADQATLQSVYADPLAPATRERMAAFYRDNRAQLARRSTSTLSTRRARPISSSSPTSSAFKSTSWRSTSSNGRKSPRYFLTPPRSLPWKTSAAR